MRDAETETILAMRRLQSRHRAVRGGLLFIYLFIYFPVFVFVFRSASLLSLSHPWLVATPNRAPGAAGQTAKWSLRTVKTLLLLHDRRLSAERVPCVHACPCLSRWTEFKQTSSHKLGRQNGMRCAASLVASHLVSTCSPLSINYNHVGRHRPSRWLAGWLVVYKPSVAESMS